MIELNVNLSHIFGSFGDWLSNEVIYVSLMALAGATMFIIILRIFTGGLGQAHNSTIEFDTDYMYDMQEVMEDLHLDRD